MITVARYPLQLEFSVFNHGQSPPWIQRWILPFGLFQARLGNRMALLNCSINPYNFEERLRCLYPHTRYHYWNPLQNGRLRLPSDLPNAPFDRILCLNTLEQLLNPQREALIAALADKLKPGGLLILTSAYHFNSPWQTPARRRLGVTPVALPKRRHGWQNVTPQAWLDLCKEHDLHPLGDIVEEPHANDLSLYRHAPPHSYTCIGGVFCKSAHAELPVGKKIVLSLLTWNTRNYTLDSVRAYLREAHMLRRLGQEPYLCICDNGSTDGTAEALQALKAESDLPYHLILNAENRGISIAKNQIIDYMLAIGADYLLFMDGDIEIVPGSSFAMLRHMENSGPQLGCIGTDHYKHTTKRTETTPYFYHIDRAVTRNVNWISSCHYGMFRRAVFENGIRFDQTSSFGQVGWGFEDNDLAFQLEAAGYLNQQFLDIVYLHREAKSSVRIMRQKGLDVTALTSQRLQYLINKWASVPHIYHGPLVHLRQLDVKQMFKQVVIGLGTGRCGTKSLSYLLNLQENAEVYHETRRYKIAWENSEKEIDAFLQWAEGKKNRRVVGDVGFYYLPYVEYILLRHPEIKFVCLQRACASTVASYMKHTRGRNHWMEHDGTRWKVDQWDHCYPKYDVVSKKKAIELYWHDYYSLATKFQEKYPHSFRIFPTSALNTEDGQRSILSFIGIPNAKMHLRVGIRLNRVLS